MTELIGWLVISGTVGTLIYKVIKMEIEIDKILKRIQFDNSRLAHTDRNVNFLRSRVDSNNRDITSVKLEMRDKDKLEVEWEKTQARKEYEERLEQIKRVEEIHKGE